MESLEATSISKGQASLLLKSKQGGRSAFPFILGAVLGFLLAGGWSSNLIVFFITVMNIKSIDAAQINNIILGCTSLFPIAGAVIADSFFSSFSVICVFAFVSLLGVVMLTLASTIHSLRPPPCFNVMDSSYACETPTKLQYAVLYLALALASVGQGGSRFTIATMGADQFDNSNDQGTFFSWYFFTAYVATTTSITGIVYVQGNVSWGVGFGICVIANAMGLAVFLLGKGFYRQRKPKGSPFAGIARVVVAAIRKRRILQQKETVERLEDYFHGDSTEAVACRSPSQSLRFLNCAALRTEGDRLPDGSYSCSWWLCTVEEVEDLKTLIKIMPIWSSSILLSITIAMINSLTVLQALTMDRHLGPNFQIPAGSFLVFTLVATALSIFLINQFLLPMWQNLTGRSLKPLQRIGIGHVLNIFAMVGSAIVESRRLHVVRTRHLTLTVIGEPSTSIVPMSGLWLVVPLALIGAGEGFHFPGQVAFYYQEFPKSLKSTSTAMISLLIAIGYYLSTVLTDFIRRSTGWLPNDISNGRLDLVYWLLAVIALVNFGYYILCSKLFKYQNM